MSLGAPPQMPGTSGATTEGSILPCLPLKLDARWSKMPTHRMDRLLLTREGDKVFQIPQTPRGHRPGTYLWINDWMANFRGKDP